MQSLEDRILNVRDEVSFETLALEVFQYQSLHVPIYREYVQQLGITAPKTIWEIPFLPISFFKSHDVISSEVQAELTFMSSGTGGTRSRHLVAKASLYERAFNQGYDRLIGNPEKQVILALLPNYLEQGNSSLVYMVEHLIRRTNHPLSGFFLDDLQGLTERYQQAITEGREVVIFGVSYALLDLAAMHPDLSTARIIETGGMKGRRQELTKSALHDTLHQGLSGPRISSEYGMTELLSQAYSAENGIFKTSDTLRILIRDTDDPFSWEETGKTGGINVIDLANLYSCSFIETQDLGRISDNGFEIMGRMDLADLRGCNLMVE